MRIRFKILLIFIASSIYSFGQSINIETTKLIDTFYYHSVTDLEKSENGFLILGAKKDENQYDNDFFITEIDYDYNVISQKEISLNYSGLSLKDIIITEKHDICGVGSRFLDNGEMLNYVICLNNTLTKKWDLFLNEKHEGSINGFYYDDLFYIITNDNKSYLIYLINDLGQIKDSLILENGYAETLEEIKVLNDGFMIYGWSIQENQSRIDLIHLDYDLNVINKKSFPFNDTPISLSLINKNSIAITWETTPSTVTFYSSDLKISETKKYIRHDFVFKYVLSNSDGLITYLGVNKNSLTGFITKDKQVLDYKNFSPIGIWGKTFTIELDKDRYLIATDKKRNSDFESNIELIEMKIE